MMTQEEFDALPRRERRQYLTRAGIYHSWSREVPNSILLKKTPKKWAGGDAVDHFKAGTRV